MAHRTHPQSSTHRGQNPPNSQNRLLISNTENEAYSALKSATARELDARLLLAAANRPALSRLTDRIPRGLHPHHTAVELELLVHQHEEGTPSGNRNSLAGVPQSSPPAVTPG